MCELHPITLLGWEILAAILQLDLGKEQRRKGLKMMFSVVDDYESIFRKGSADLLSTYKRFGDYLYLSGDLERAEQIYELALEGYSKLRGLEDTKNCSVMMLLVNVLQQQGKMASAAPLCESGLHICEALFRKNPNSSGHLLGMLGVLAPVLKVQNHPRAWLIYYQVRAKCQEITVDDPVLQEYLDSFLSISPYASSEVVFDKCSVLSEINFSEFRYS